MSFIVTIVHVFVSLFLMLTVLLQAGKGGGMGATFGGGSSQGSVFGGSGAGNFLSRLTTASAAVFMITSMTLAFLASTTGEDSLKKFSAQQRQAAQQKADRDKEAQDLYLDTQPDEATTDGVDDGTDVAPEDTLDDQLLDSTEPADTDEPATDEAANDETATELEPPAVKPVAEPKPAAVKPVSEPKPAAVKPAAEPEPAAVKPAAEPKPAAVKPAVESKPAAGTDAPDGDEG